MECQSVHVVIDGAVRFVRRGMNPGEIKGQVVDVDFEAWHVHTGRILVSA